MRSWRTLRTVTYLLYNAKTAMSGCLTTQTFVLDANTKVARAWVEADCEPLSDTDINETQRPGLANSSGLRGQAFDFDQGRLVFVRPLQSSQLVLEGAVIGPKTAWVAVPLPPVQSRCTWIKLTLSNHMDDCIPAFLLWHSRTPLRAIVRFHSCREGKSAADTALSRVCLLGERARAGSKLFHETFRC